jgi:hypothetical protein
VRRVRRAELPSAESGVEVGQPIDDQCSGGRHRLMERCVTFYPMNFLAQDFYKGCEEKELPRPE